MAKSRSQTTDTLASGKRNPKKKKNDEKEAIVGRATQLLKWHSNKAPVVQKKSCQKRPPKK